MSTAGHAPSGRRIWPQPDGTPLSCTEKLVVLDENWQELHQVMVDTFEDAVLMGVDEAVLRDLLRDMVASLKSPHQNRPD